MAALPALAAFWREFRENRIAVAALAVLATIAAVTLAAPLVAPQDPYDLANLDLADARRPPGPVGTRGYAPLRGTHAPGRAQRSALI